MLVDKIIRYGKLINKNGNLNTPIEIVEGLLDTWEILKVKQALASRGFTGSIKVPSDRYMCLENIMALDVSNEDNYVELLINTIYYIEYRNPILKGVSKKFVINPM